MEKYALNREGLKIPVSNREFEEYHGITLCCISFNEEKRIREFLEYHRPYVKEIILIDGGSNDKTVEIASTLVDKLKIRIFDGHYSNQANRAFELVETDWILLMDCDEKLEIKALENLKLLIDQEEFDCYSFPRKNFIDGKYDGQHFPDYQERLHRAYCRRVRPVHGEVVGYKKKKEMPCEDGNYIIHSKESKTHDDRNLGYVVFEAKFKNEMGEPGAQMKETFESKYPTLKKPKKK